MHVAIAHGIHLFNAGKFFEAHEALEAVWLKAEGEKKVFLHGLIQVAAAFHHHTRRNSAGCRSLLGKGLAKLEKFRAEEWGVDVAGLLEQLDVWQQYLPHAGRARGKSPPPLPRISTTVTRDHSAGA